MKAVNKIRLSTFKLVELFVKLILMVVVAVVVAVVVVVVVAFVVVGRNTGQTVRIFPV